MQITTSYTADIKQQAVVEKVNKEEKIIGYTSVDKRLMKITADTCLEALKLMVDIFLAEWDYLSIIPTSQKKGRLSRKRAGDILVHNTKDSKSKYPEFDERFPNMPSFTRRAIVSDALGKVSSYKSNLKNWEEADPKERGKMPTVGLPDRYELTFYKQERNLCDLDKGIVGLKLFNGKTWEWYYFKLNPSEARHISDLAKHRKMLSPTIQKYKDKYSLKFTFEENKDLVDNTNPLSYTILSVDLGINAPASWAIMTADGTVHAKGVIHLGCDEDRLNRLVNRKRQYQQAGKRCKSIYRQITAANKQLSIDTCRKIIDIAVLYSVDRIIFEYLDRNGKKKGKRYKERIHLWRANDVQDRVELNAHRLGMRISRVCAWGTSKYAFNGTGEVKRGKDAKLDTYSVCRFPDGKVYNCDLSAAQNIGARYFIREYTKLCEYPELPKTPQRTYATLVGLVSNLSKNIAA